MISKEDVLKIPVKTQKKNVYIISFIDTYQEENGT